MMAESGKCYNLSSTRHLRSQAQRDPTVVSDPVYRQKDYINCIYCILRFPAHYTIIGLHVIVYVTFAPVCLRLQ